MERGAAVGETHVKGVWGEIVSKHYAKRAYRGTIEQKATRERIRWNIF